MICAVKHALYAPIVRWPTRRILCRDHAAAFIQMAIVGNPAAAVSGITHNGCCLSSQVKRLTGKYSMGIFGAILKKKMAKKSAVHFGSTRFDSTPCSASERRAIHCKWSRPHFFFISVRAKKSSQF